MHAHTLSGVQLDGEEHSQLMVELVRVGNSCGVHVLFEDDGAHVLLED